MSPKNPSLPVDASSAASRAASASPAAVEFAMLPPRVPWSHGLFFVVVVVAGRCCCCRPPLQLLSGSGTKEDMTYVKQAFVGSMRCYCLNMVRRFDWRDQTYLYGHSPLTPRACSCVRTFFRPSTPPGSDSISSNWSRSSVPMSVCVFTNNLINVHVACYHAYVF